MLNISERMKGYRADFMSALFRGMQGNGGLLELTASEDRSTSQGLASGFIVSQENGSHHIVRTSLIKAELQAIELAKCLFRASYANVQPQSGAQANAAVYQALLKPGDTILGMSTAQGGHLSNTPHPKMGAHTYRAAHYGLTPSGLVDYVHLEQLAQEHNPKLIVAGFSNYSRFLDFRKFREIADSVGARLLVDMSHVAGLVAAGLYPSPIEFAHVVTSSTQKSLRGPKGGLILFEELGLAAALDASVSRLHRHAPLNRMIAAKAQCFQAATSLRFQAHQKQVVTNARAMAQELVRQGMDVVTGGTDSHMLLLDLGARNLDAHEACNALLRVGIAVESGEHHRTPESPFASPFLQIATSAITHRGFTADSCTELAAVIAAVLRQPNDLKTVSNAAKSISSLSADYPKYPDYIGHALF